MTFDLSKCKRDGQGRLIAQMRNGRDVWLLCTNASGDYPIVGLPGLFWCGADVQSWAADGTHNAARLDGKGKLDLVNAPAEHTVTVFLIQMRGGYVGSHSSAEPMRIEDAERMYGGDDTVIARRVITLTEGEGID